jgi:hypothetical protein
VALVGDHDDLAGLVALLDDVPCVRGRADQRLLAQHVKARVEGVHDLLVVQRVRVAMTTPSTSTLSIIFR